MHPESERGLRVQLATALRERDEAKDETNARIATVIHTIGGAVEGYPTSALNYLQRLRALVAIEKAFVDAGPMVASAKYMVEKARDCERAESALAAARRTIGSLADAAAEKARTYAMRAAGQREHGTVDEAMYLDARGNSWRDAEEMIRAALASPGDGEEGKS